MHGNKHSLIFYTWVILYEIFKSLIIHDMPRIKPMRVCKEVWHTAFYHASDFKRKDGYSEKQY